jgi:hypothetical protein
MQKVAFKKMSADDMCEKISSIQVKASQRQNLENSSFSKHTNQKGRIIDVPNRYVLPGLPWQSSYQVHQGSLANQLLPHQALLHVQHAYHSPKRSCLEPPSIISQLLDSKFHGSFIMRKNS